MYSDIVQVPMIQITLTEDEAKGLAHILYHYEGGDLCITPGTGGALLHRVVDTLARLSKDSAMSMREMYGDTFHLGDCSTGCEECARRCATSDHVDCIGSEEERTAADALLAALTPGQRLEYAAASIAEVGPEGCAFEEWVEEEINA